MKYPFVSNRLFCGIVISAAVFLGPRLCAQTLEDGVALFKADKLVEAKAVFEQVIKKDDNNAEAHFHLGQLYFMRSFAGRDVDESVDQLEKAVELNPNKAEYQLMYGGALGEKVQTAGIFKKAILAPKVKHALLRAVELDPKLFEARVGLAQFYLMAPSFAGGDDDEGWKQIDEAVKLDEFRGRFVKARMLENKNKLSEADKEYKILTGLKPLEWRIWKNYGYFNLRQKKHDEAISCFHRYVNLNPDTADSHRSLAEGLIEKGSIDTAMICLTHALTIDKNYAPAVISLGDAYKAKGSKDNAKKEYERAIAMTQNETLRTMAEKKLKEL